MNATTNKAREIFLEAIELPTSEDREEYLKQACHEDDELLSRVQRLLHSHELLGSYCDESNTRNVTREIAVPEQPGDTIGPYKLLQQIGEGGMGVVYVAEQTEPVERRVALKIIKPGLDTRKVVARFEAERQALAMMDHPNIAKVLDAGATETGRPYFVMELVNGVPITQYCDDRQLTPRERLELFVPICEAVQHAHQKGIIHRDIKPSNVLVAEYDERGVPKIIDFGVAKAIEKRLTEKTVFTEFGQIVGTPEYMSPEQAEFNHHDVDTRTDIYSLGVLLYELLTGETPFDRERLRSAAFDELLRIIREEDPPRPSLRLNTSESLPSVAANRHVEPKQLSATVHGELDWIVMRALEKDRTRRYSTASKFAEDVQHYLNDEAVTACPPSVLYRFRKFARRNKPLIVTTATIAAVLLIATVVSTWQAIRATKAENLARERLAAEQEAHEEAQQQRKRAEANLDLAMKALDEIYLGAMAEDKLSTLSTRVAEERDASDYRPEPLSEVDGKWLGRGLEFYDQFARQNESATNTVEGAALAYHRVGAFQATRGSLEDATNAYRAAIERFEKLTKEHPANADYYSRLADAYRGLAWVLPQWSEAKGKLAEALQAYARAIELRSNDALLYLDHAEIAKALSQPKQANDDYEKAAELAPDNVEVLLACSQHYSSRSRFRDLDKARELAQHALELAPDNPKCYISVGALLADTDSGRALQHYNRSIELAPSPQAYKARAALYLQEGKRELAMADADRGLELSPSDGDLLYVRAQIYLQREEYDKALADLAVMKHLYPTSASAHLLTGYIYRAMGNYQAAIAELDKAIERHPNNWAVYKRRASAHAHLGHYDEALADVSKALELEPTDLSALWYIERPLRNASPEYWNKFFALADQAVEANMSPRSFDSRAYLNFHYGRFNEAAADFDRCIEWGDNGHQRWHELALSRLAGGDVVGYRDACRAVLEQFRDTKDPLAAGSAAWTCALGANAVDQYDVVVALAQRPVAERSASPAKDLFGSRFPQPAAPSGSASSEWVRTLGAVLFRAGRTDEAIERLTEASKMECRSDDESWNWPYIAYFLAMAHHARGEAETAQQWLAKAIARTDEVLAAREENYYSFDALRQPTLELLREEARAVIEGKAEDERPSPPAGDLGRAPPDAEETDEKEESKPQE